MAESGGSGVPFSALGYLFQCRYALLRTLKLGRSKPDLSVRLESLDDVEFEEGTSKELLQLKHHVATQGSLGDMSEDWWRTLKGWIALEETANPPDAYFLVTTASASPGTAAALLSPPKRSPDEALTKFQVASTNSTSESNRVAYQAFKDMGPDNQLALVERIYVLAGHPTIEELKKLIREELTYAVAPNHLDSFVERIEGWWFGRCVSQLSAGSTNPIYGSELQGKISDLQDQFKSDNLPIDIDVLEHMPSPEDYSHQVFVQQLELIEIVGQRIAFAIQDYVRAFTQRSRWVREELIVVDELDRYERRLTEEWARHFEEMRERLGDHTTESAKVDAAKALYKWVEQDAQLRIRDRCDELFVTRGSYQILANQARVGWHVDFSARLASLLEPT